MTASEAREQSNKAELNDADKVQIAEIDRAITSAVKLGEFHTTLGSKTFLKPRVRNYFEKLGYTFSTNSRGEENTIVW